MSKESPIKFSATIKPKTKSKTGSKQNLTNETKTDIQPLFSNQQLSPKNLPSIFKHKKSYSKLNYEFLSAKETKDEKMLKSSNQKSFLSFMSESFLKIDRSSSKEMIEKAKSLKLVIENQKLTTKKNSITSVVPIKDTTKFKTIAFLSKKSTATILHQDQTASQDLSKDLKSKISKPMSASAPISLANEKQQSSIDKPKHSRSFYLNCFKIFYETLANNEMLCILSVNLLPILIFAFFRHYYSH